MNSGVLRVVRFQAQEGSLVRPAYPAAVGWGQTHPRQRDHQCGFQPRSARVRISLCPACLLQAFVRCCFCQVSDLFRLILSSILGAASVDGVNGLGSPPVIWPGASCRRSKKCEIAFPEISIERLEIVADGQGGWRRNTAPPASEVRVALRQPALGNGLSQRTAPMRQVRRGVRSSVSGRKTRSKALRPFLCRPAPCERGVDLAPRPGGGTHQPLRKRKPNTRGRPLIASFKPTSE